MTCSWYRVLGVVAHVCGLNVDYRLPNLGAFVRPGTIFDSVSSAPRKGSGRRLGKALAEQKGGSTSYSTSSLSLASAD